MKSTALPPGVTTRPAGRGHSEAEVGRVYRMLRGAGLASKCVVVCSVGRCWQRCGSVCMLIVSSKRKGSSRRRQGLNQGKTKSPQL